MHKIRSTELKLTLKNVDAPPTNELLKSKKGDFNASRYHQRAPGKWEINDS